MFIRPSFRSLDSAAATTVELGGAPAAPEAPAAAAPAAPAAPATPPAFAIPDAYKDRGYLKGVDSIDKVYKMLDGAQELIGKRPAGIPAPDAPDAEWDKFYEAVGRPKTSDEYQLPDKTLDGQERDPGLMKIVKDAAHKAGLHSKQAMTFVDMIDKGLAPILTQRKEADAANDVAFTALADKTFGTDKDKILERSRKLLQAHTPKGFEDRIAQMSNEDLILHAAVLNSIHGKYIKEDDITGGGPIVSSEAELRAEGQKLMTSDAFKDAFHKDHNTTKQRVTEIYSKIGQMQKK